MTEKNANCVLDQEPRKDIYESTGTSMTRDDLQDCLDLSWAEIDPERFAAALPVQHIRCLIAAGGNGAGRPDEEEAFYPHHCEAFLARAVETARKTRRFEQEWRRLQLLVPQVQAAWERGQVLFQEDLACAAANPERCVPLSD